ncbi:hypothetical protein [uncultured Maribacter sp.]|uniref:OB-fold protein n=1 Tax=uncultured Maribacter sp. TaxID=431308 RepID=UPI0026330370|nr:hypothetical protein [uncultured Maribacter sp.]
MKFKKIKMGVFIFLLFLLAAVFFSLWQYNKPHINVAVSKADISLSAEKLFTDFSTDEAGSNAKYLDQIVEVTGLVSNIGTEKGQTVITLGKGNIMGSVLCYLAPEQLMDNNTLKKGQQITIKGICTGYLMDVILVKSVLVN